MKDQKQTLSKVKKFKYEKEIEVVSYIPELVTTQSIRGGLCARFNKHIHAI
jgi:hypothetical protein